MARPRKDGLDYFPLDADFFEDEKIRILKARYGADGIILYIYLLCRIYKHGYYMKVNEDFEYLISDDLKMSPDKVKQVLTFLLSRSLFDNTLFQSDAVLTSAGIQRRFQLAVKERAKKNPIQAGRYWLLKEAETEPFIKCTQFEGFSQKNNNSSGKNKDNSREQSLKESKVNNDIYNTSFPPELERAFQLYLSVREHNFGEIIPEQVQALREDLLSLSNDQAEQLAIVKKATAGGWKSFYKSKEKSGKKTQEKKDVGKKRSKFSNFQERSYDMNDLERKLVEKGES
ncbi:DUF4373 domain-containing protein [uncultured Merdimonas sp.]|uniref:DUF4373 domain-containing protein n=1 Tax=uncultured Merdimonas sp. TaxID=2023269 RepID=UPI0032093DE3